jgi:hypothetical protein
LNLTWICRCAIPSRAILPRGEGKTFATGLKIYKVGFAGRSFAYAADDALTLLRIHSGTLYNARAACKMV